jgi:hypothetical protein
MQRVPGRLGGLILVECGGLCVPRYFLSKSPLGVAPDELPS